MKAFFKRLIKSKTFWLCAVGIVFLIVVMSAGKVGITLGVLAIIGMLIIMFLRDAIAKLK